MARPAGRSTGCKVPSSATDCCAAREKSGRSEPDCCRYYSCYLYCYCCCCPSQLLFGGAPWPAKQSRRPVRENNLVVVLPGMEGGRKELDYNYK